MSMDNMRLAGLYGGLLGEVHQSCELLQPYTRREHLDQRGDDLLQVLAAASEDFQLEDEVARLEDVRACPSTLQQRRCAQDQDEDAYKVCDPLGEPDGVVAPVTRFDVEGLEEPAFRGEAHVQLRMSARSKAPHGGPCMAKPGQGVHPGRLTLHSLHEEFPKPGQPENGKGAEEHRDHQGHRRHDEIDQLITHFFLCQLA
mmetsp:Transcript_134320/g.318412  ORF Transcript_134320/g.318412 Transcript_134320/m.318412 type:complete len:200 (+) Transcript_134320:456-1055(+)